MERWGLSLADGVGESRASPGRRLAIENGWNTNPTLETLYRYASAVGLHIRLMADRVDDPVRSEEEAAASRPQVRGPGGNGSLRQEQRGKAGTTLLERDGVEIIRRASPSRLSSSR